MTAPEIDTTTSTTDTAPTSAFEDVIASTLQSLPPSDESSAEAEAARVRDEKGRFVAPQAETPAPGTETATDGTTPLEGEADATAEEATLVEVPEGYTLPAILPPERSSFFTVKDAEGEIAAPDLTWEITANGKPRTLSTDKLVQYAQMGVYNHEREQAYEHAQSYTQELSSTVEDLRATLTERNQQFARLLSDPDYLVQSIQEFEQYNTPEMQLARERQAIEQERQQQQTQQMEHQAEAFVTNELDPAIQTIASTMPTIGFEELAARLFMHSQRYRGPDGVLRPEGFQPLQQYILHDLIPWARQVHESRQSERQAPNVEAEQAKAKAEANAKAAQIRAQKAKRQAALATQPVGRRTAPDAPPPKPIRSIRDAEDSIVTSVLSGMRDG